MNAIIQNYYELSINKRYLSETHISSLISYFLSSNNNIPYLFLRMHYQFYS